MKLGIVGSGMIVKDFLKMFNELNGIELLGISARNEENLKNLCVQYPIEPVSYTHLTLPTIA